jgi:hypothetical protein
MHPDVMGEVIRQRSAERQAEARRTNLVRAVRKMRRQRSRTEGQDTFAVPPIPDYVDGTFRTTENAGSHAPAGRGAR